jgi:hypothetical protein
LGVKTKVNSKRGGQSDSQQVTTSGCSRRQDRSANKRFVAWQAMGKLNRVGAQVYAAKRMI